MAAPCSTCGAKKIASVHGRYYPGRHDYVDGTRPGLNPIGAGRRRFNESEEGKAYNARTRALRDGTTPCQVQSPVCSGWAQSQDEALTRGRAGGIAAALRDGPQPTLCCFACNTYLAENLVWSADHGFARLKPPHR